MTKIKNLDLLSISEVAKKESVATNTVYVWIKKGEISPLSKIGKTIFIGKNYKIAENILKFRASRTA